MKIPKGATARQIMKYISPEFHITELSRKLKIDVSTIQKAVKELEELGYIKQKKKIGNVRILMFTKKGERFRLKK